MITEIWRVRSILFNSPFVSNPKIRISNRIENTKQYTEYVIGDWNGKYVQ